MRRADSFFYPLLFSDSFRISANTNRIYQNLKLDGSRLRRAVSGAMSEASDSEIPVSRALSRMQSITMGLRRIMPQRQQSRYQYNSYHGRWESFGLPEIESEDPEVSPWPHVVLAVVLVAAVASTVSFVSEFLVKIAFNFHQEYLLSQPTALAAFSGTLLMAVVAATLARLVVVAHPTAEGSAEPDL